MLARKNLTRTHHRLISIITKIILIPMVCRFSTNHRWEIITLMWFRDTKSHANAKSHAGAQRSHRDTISFKIHPGAQRSHWDTSSSDLKISEKIYDCSRMYVFNETGFPKKEWHIKFTIGIVCFFKNWTTPSLSRTDTETNTLNNIPICFLIRWTKHWPSSQLERRLSFLPREKMWDQLESRSTPVGIASFRWR